MNPERVSRRVAVTSMLVSGGLAAAKDHSLDCARNSTAVVSDGLESAGDVLASGLVLLGLVMAAKPPDAQHPYGHGRLETLSALVVGMMLVVAGSLISARSLERAWEVAAPAGGVRDLAGGCFHRDQERHERDEADATRVRLAAPR